MAVADLIKGESRTAFSFEVLPPLKGTGMKGLFASIDELMEFNPLYINITNHRSEVSYKELPNGMFKRFSLRRRPSTVPVAAAIHNRYNITTVPHILCSGYSREEIENTLFDLQYLGITDLLVLRGDKAKDESMFTPAPNGWSHAIELQGQINDFNRGIFTDGSTAKESMEPFHCGVAGYPERHEEAPNMEQDMYWLKKKVEAGAEYIVTQIFYDNSKFLSFVERARQEGIGVPIIPGIKPFRRKKQLNVLPKTFNIELPQQLVAEVGRCQTDDEVQAAGIEWCISQCRELIAAGVPSIHFYTMGAVAAVKAIAKNIY